MQSKSSFYTFFYGLIAAVITAAFANGRLGELLAAIGVAPFRADLIACLALAACALVAAAFGGSKQGIVILATIASFIVLTAHQDLAMTRYMTLAAVLFAIGVYGLIASRNAVRMLISIELMINAANINFVAMAKAVDPSDIQGQVFAIFVLAVAAAEAAVGLAIVLAVYRNMSTVDMEKFNLLKW